MRCLLGVHVICTNLSLAFSERLIEDLHGLKLATLDRTTGSLALVSGVQDMHFLELQLYRITSSAVCFGSEELN